jgi:selenium metabolism protein YedF
METLNCLGQSCPQPVMAARNFVEAHPQQNEFRVLVDNPAAAENVKKFLASRGFEAVVGPEGSDFQIKARKTGASGCELAVQGLIGGETKTMVVVTQDKLGTGDDQLGAQLMLNLLKTLKEMGNSLWRLVFLNSGVKLTIEGSEALPAIQELSTGGVCGLVCGTCLNHFNLLELKRVGETTNMLDIVTSMQVAEKVISF